MKKIIQVLITLILGFLPILVSANIDGRLSIRNSAPTPGFDTANIIPITKVTRYTDGSGKFLIQFKAIDTERDPFLLTGFGYSINNGQSFFEVDDNSASLSDGWPDNQRRYFNSGNTFGTATAYSFVINTKHTHLSHLNQIESNTVKFRFMVYDGAYSGYAVTESIIVDNLAPRLTTPLTMASRPQSGGTVYFSGQFTDGNPSSNSLFVKKNNQDWGPALPAGSSQVSAVIDGDDVINGIKLMNVDIAGNSAVTINQSLPPAVSAVKPLPPLAPDTKYHNAKEARLQIQGNFSELGEVEYAVKFTSDHDLGYLQRDGTLKETPVYLKFSQWHEHGAVIVRDLVIGRQYQIKAIARNPSGDQPTQEGAQASYTQVIPVITIPESSGGGGGGGGGFFSALRQIAGALPLPGPIPGITSSPIISPPTTLVPPPATTSPAPLPAIQPTVPLPTPIVPANAPRLPQPPITNQPESKPSLPESVPLEKKIQPSPQDYLPSAAKGVAISQAAIRWHFLPAKIPPKEYYITVDNKKLLQVTGPFWLADGSGYLEESGLDTNNHYSGRQICSVYDHDHFCSKALVGVYTLMPEPTDLGTTEVTYNSVTVEPKDLFLNLKKGRSGLIFTIIDQDSGWIQDTDFTFKGLISNTKYLIKFKARNGDGIETKEISREVTTSKFGVASFDLNLTGRLTQKGKTKSSKLAEINDVIEYQIELINKSLKPVYNLKVQSLIPSGTKLFSPTAAATDLIADTITFKIDELRPKAKHVFDYQVKIIKLDPNTIILNQAELKESDQTRTLVSPKIVFEAKKDMKKMAAPIKKPTNALPSKFVNRFLNTFDRLYRRIFPKD